MLRALQQEEAVQSCRRTGRLSSLLSSAQLALLLQNQQPLLPFMTHPQCAQKSGSLPRNVYDV